METSSIKDAGSDKIFTMVNYTVLSLFLIIVLYPLVFIVSVIQQCGCGHLWKSMVVAGSSLIGWVYCGI